jgi:starvation-inducible DNA-binding protein
MSTAPTDIRQVGVTLQDALVVLTDLGLQAKQAHWNVTGPLFLPLHAQLDTLAEEVRVSADRVAERAAAVGHAPDARASTVAKESPLAEPAAGPLSGDVVLEHLVSVLGVATERLRTHVHQLDQVDPISQDLLIGVAHDLEAQRWIFRAQQV